MIDSDVAGLDKLIDDAARAVFWCASGEEKSGKEYRDEDFGDLSPNPSPFRRGGRKDKTHSKDRTLPHFFLNSASSFDCAADLPCDAAPAPLPSPGVKYSQKLKRSLSTTRSAIGSRQLLL